MSGTQENGAQKPKTKGFPVQQLFVLSLCRICEPISFCSIFPYIYYMIKSFGNAKTDNEIAVYAGLVTSAFAFAEFTTGMMWGRISDKYGRKPVLIMGLVGTMLSMIIFGFAKSFPVALLARAVGGALNGNIGVIQTTVAELVTEREHQPKAYAVMPFIWCLGSIIGPALGGLLAEPVTRYPNWFSPGGILEEYPYLFPNMVSAGILVIGIIIGSLFLEETHQVLREKPDRGIIAGRKIIAFFKRSNNEKSKYEGLNGYNSPPSESERLIAQDGGSNDNSGYETFDNSVAQVKKAIKPPSVEKAFTPPVVLLIVSYGILAYHTMGFEQLFPVFLSTPPADEPPHHPFKFVGGFGLSTQAIGFILSMQGLISMTAQFFLFPPIVEYFGSFKVYRFCMLVYPIGYIIVPYLDFLPAEYSMAGIYAVLVIKIILGVMAYPCNAILLTNSAPSLLVLGTINGVAASTASIFRAFGPTITGIIYSKGLDYGIVGLAWWVNAAVCVLGGIQALWMVDGALVLHPEVEAGEMDEEAVEQMAVDVQIAHAGVSSTEGFVNEYHIVKKAAEDEIEHHQQEVAASFGTSRSFDASGSFIASRS
ncbi:uncharacterized protein LAJ45_04724 [Morchella importuna]|uniref:MFS general substrate transporter n=1 Tax=Morchella conica CCBAS932 TaxID=1392247 RepID=A0A3N4KD52_9PEZI|nr:uncharacterized protein LAJ45_04724 [Morchella importuna]KAH8151023.1 hypothetical protein LAJ45_04724 [Morchella importuna]RPB08436.1 MFS general substrate transporter [Morchella conica CCBAS932]